MNKLKILFFFFQELKDIEDRKGGKRKAGDGEDDSEQFIGARNRFKKSAGGGGKPGKKKR